MPYALEKEGIKTAARESIFSWTEQQSDSDRAQGVLLSPAIAVRDQPAEPAGPVLW